MNKDILFGRPFPPAFILPIKSGQELKANVKTDLTDWAKNNAGMRRSCLENEYPVTRQLFLVFWTRVVRNCEAKPEGLTGWARNTTRVRRSCLNYEHPVTRLQLLLNFWLRVFRYCEAKPEVGLPDSFRNTKWEKSDRMSDNQFARLSDDVQIGFHLKSKT